MKSRLLLVLLILSLIFNVFFLIGALRQPAKRNAMAELARVAHELRLDDRQAERFGELRDSFRGEAGVVGEELREVRQAIRDALASESVDTAALEQLMARESELIASRRELAAGHFGRFVDLLTPQQRHDLGRRLHGGRGERPGDPHLLVQKFDADGDGALDDVEWREAHRLMEQRRDKRAVRREELRRQFDLDANGELEPEEREAMRAWLLEQGFSPPQDGPRRHPPRGDGPRGGPPPGGGHGPRGGPPPGGGPGPPPL
ncbi:MAG: periplasmic heavy metal sensor [Phycisphaerales bacterium]|nr:periplasmic heavy metal sensor [Phycisphaerales bacterium]